MDILTRTAERLFMPLCLVCGLGPGREGSGRALEPGGSSRGAKSLRPDLRTANSEDGRTSYWQGLEQTRQNAARTVFQALRGSPIICVTRSKTSLKRCGPTGFSVPPRKALPLPSHPGPRNLPPQSAILILPMPLYPYQPDNLPLRNLQYWS